MPVSAYMPDVTVEVAFDSGYGTPAVDRTWTDVSAYVEARETITIGRGRGDELAQVQPSRLALTLDNSDGRFTPGNVAGAHYPNIRLGRPIRIRAVWATVTYDRFTGYVTDWPVVWPDGTDSASHVTIGASSRGARLAAGMELRSIVEEEYLLDDPDAYYPLGEPEGAAAAGNVAATHQPALTQAGAGTAVSFGTGTGPGTDGLTAAMFAAGKHLTGTLGTTATGPLSSGTWTVFLEAFINTSTAAARWAVALTNSAGDYMAIGTDATGKLIGKRVTGNPVGTPATVYTLTSAGSVADGATHHVALEESLSLGGDAPVLYLDGVAAVTGVTNSEMFYSLGTLSLGNNPGNVLTGFTGTMAHAAMGVVSAPVGLTRFEAHADAGSTGFSGESSDARVERLATYAGIATAEVSTEAGLSTSVAHIETNGRTTENLMRQIESTESGLVFDATDGTLTFHGRGHRYNVASSFTLDAGSQEVEATLAPVLDDQFIANDVTASRVGGISLRVVDTASVDENGPYRVQLELVTTSDDEVADAANWRVNRYAEPQVRITSVDVDLLNMSTSLKTALLAAEIGDRFTVEDLPAQAPAAEMDFFVEGITETIGAELYTVSFNVSAVSESDVWQLDSSVYSVLGTSSILAY